MEGKCKKYKTNCHYCKKDLLQFYNVYKNQLKLYGHNRCKKCFSNLSEFKEQRKEIMLTNNPFKGKQHSIETRKILSEKRKGKSSWNKGLTKETDSRVLKNGLGTSKTKKLNVENISGVNNPNYKHGKAKDNLRFAGLSKHEWINKYLPFRMTVLTRDCFGCWKCNNIFSPKQLQVHHLVSKAKHPEYLYDEMSCITLCKECHKEFHKRYTTTKFTPENAKTWLNENRLPHEKIISWH